MDIIKSDARTVTLERYSIKRSAAGAPVQVRAWLLLTMPSDIPSTMRLRVDYEYSDIPNPDEKKLGTRIVQLLARRLFD
jgi:hypothetical protein